MKYLLIFMLLLNQGFANSVFKATFVDEPKKEVKTEELNITQQIELSFHKSHLKNAEETMTPAKLHAMGGENAYIDMTPEQFDTALQYLSAEQPKSVPVQC